MSVTTSLSGILTHFFFTSQSTVGGATVVGSFPKAQDLNIVEILS